MISVAQQIYYAWDIHHKRSTSDDDRFTGVMSEAKVDLNPHQIEAALFAFKSPLSKGAILADEVGLGKTIEAGIILSELWAEQKRKILIIVPASLRTQWNIELIEKFYLPSVVMETGLYNSFICKKKNPFEIQDSIVICSYNFAVSHAAEVSNVMWDVVVFDEAHKLRNVYKKENITANTLNNALRPFKKILLTATPLQNNLKELYGLISIIDNEFFVSAKIFEERYNAVTTRDNSRYGELKARVAHITHRTLRKQVQEYVKYTKRIAFVQEYAQSESEQKLYSLTNDYLLRADTFGISDRCRPLMSMMIRKIMASSYFALSFTLSKIIQRLQELLKNGFTNISVEDVLTDNELSIDEEQELGYTEENLTINKYELEREIEELKEIRELAESINEESKAIQLLEGLDAAFKQLDTLGAQRKALLFTESCRTQEYLRQYLENHGYNGKVVTYNGTNNDPATRDIYGSWVERHKGTSRFTGNSIIDKKQALVDYFQNDADIMIATEAGAEGINLQFCSLVINYDMPWNPQRIEQRIGRCHRYGQKHDVVVMNFVNQRNVAEQRVYELLTDKFSLFSGVFGSSDEVIGAIDATINLEKRINDIYQTCRTEQEINDAFDTLQREMDAIISERVVNTKKALLENFDEDVVNKLRIRQGTDVVRIDAYIEHFWKLAINLLNEDIVDVDYDTRSFTLTNSINENIPAGNYTFNKNNSSGILIRYSHPFGKFIIDKCFSVDAIPEEVEFDLSNYPYRSMIIEEHKEKRGWLTAYKVKSFNQYDEEENVIFVPMLDDGTELSHEFGSKLMELPTNSLGRIAVPSEVETDITFKKRLTEYRDKLKARNDEFAAFEIEKYESFYHDKLVPMENEIKDIRHRYDDIRKTIRRTSDIRQKLLLKRQETELSRELSAKLDEYHKQRDKYNSDVDEMTEKLLVSMENNIEYSKMFQLRWRIV